MFDEDLARLHMLVVITLLKKMDEELILKDSLFKYGPVVVFNAARVFFITAREWLCLIPVLNYKGNWPIMELYKKILIVLIDRGVFDNEPGYKDSEFTRVCLDLWANSPRLKVEENLDAPLPSLRKLPSHLQSAAILPSIRRGKYSRCHYCDTGAACHFSDETCKESATTRVRCFPSAGIHCCNSHGSKCLLSRGKQASLERIFVTQDKRMVPNLKKLGNDEGVFEETADKVQGLRFYGRVPNNMFASYLDELLRVFKIPAELMNPIKFKEHYDNFFDERAKCGDFFKYHAAMEMILTEKLEIAYCIDPEGPVGFLMDPPPLYHDIVGIFSDWSA